MKLLLCASRFYMRVVMLLLYFIKALAQRHFTTITQQGLPHHVPVTDLNQLVDSTAAASNQLSTALTHQIKKPLIG